ncbi:MAG: T9SS type A sorting domain-containing protein [Candidatus Marinimicrobia bacterium]|nr:T9SS type A sorting domain-containing protein [Candidatus Neomarinimicrobiota bacterium]
MHQKNLGTILLTFAIMIMSSSILSAQGMGGGGHHGGGHGGPGDGWGPGDSTGCDSTGYGGDHDGPGCGDDSTGFGGHYDGDDDHGWWNNDSTGFDSVFVSGTIMTVIDSMGCGGFGHQGDDEDNEDDDNGDNDHDGEWCDNDSSHSFRTSYLLDIDADGLAEFRLMHLQFHLDSDTLLTLPENGDLVEISGAVFENDILDFLFVFDMEILEGAIPDADVLALDGTLLSKHHSIATQSYPNPFNPSTTIEFALDKAGLTTLKVYNMRGVEVADLAHAYLEAGTHNVEFNPQTLSAGVYLYVIESNGLREVKRMAYLK